MALGREVGEPIRVVVADDHPAVRRALARAVSEHPQLELVGEATDGESIVELIADLAPDVALIDVRMPRLDGLGVLRRLVQQRLSVRVVLISGFEDSAIVHEAISHGAAGFLSKDAEEEEICEAIIAVANGESVLSASLHSGVFATIRHQRTVELSPQEHALLDLAASGATNSEIARRLALSPHTVRTYWKRVYEKLGVHDRAAATAEAMRRGLVK